ncbi:glycine cleavage system protein GcvH [Lolliginicoccus suaedae]|uniref:glycine cleavage system protein GcvH n=1 Tax=Lolliginicoccus suaedae TaxID=2605429 RepID=UPI0011EC7B27|nr:glycine cleavage system protein GcvH [Lolliginicoccus suaedae]
MTEASLPEDLRYTREHEWVRKSGESTVRIGITDYAQRQLNDVVFVQLPEVGDEVTAGEPFGEVESTKSVSDIFAPLTGTISALNDALVDAPELVNTDPYSDGWLVEIAVADAGALDDELAGMLGAAEYRGISGDE